MIPAIAENTDALFDKITLSQVEKLDLFSKQYEIKGSTCANPLISYCLLLVTFYLLHCAPAHQNKGSHAGSWMGFWLAIFRMSAGTNFLLTTRRKRYSLTQSSVMMT